MAESGFLGRVLRAGGRALRANLPLVLLCALVLTLIQHFQIRGQINMMNVALSSSDSAALNAEGGKLIGFSLLQGAIYLFLYMTLLFGSHAAILYRPGGEIRPGFAHFAHAPGSLGRFCWRLIVVSFRILLLLLPVAILLGFVLGGLAGRGDLMGTMGLGLLMMLAAGMVALYASARYGLALPAAVADDADLSIAAAVERVRPRMGDLFFALVVVTLGPILAQIGLEFLFRGMVPQFAAVSTQPAFGTTQGAGFFRAMIENLQALRVNPAFWAYVALTAVLGLISAVYAAAALSVGYRDAAEEGLARPGARL